MVEQKTPPIEEQPYSFGVNIVDIGDLRVARGMSRRPVHICRHKPLVYDQRERRIWCKDCENDVEPFDAFLLIVENFNKAASDIENKSKALKEAEAHKIRLIATKKIDKLFSSKKYIPTCPHCDNGIFPEDIGKMGQISREWEFAKRAKKEAGQ